MSEKYINLYKQYHNEHINYGNGGGLKFYLNYVVDLVRDTKSETILDYGRGKAEGYLKYNHLSLLITYQLNPFHYLCSFPLLSF